MASPWLRPLALFASFMSLLVATVLLISSQNQDSSPKAITYKLTVLDTLFLNNFSLDITDSAENSIFSMQNIRLPLPSGVIPVDIMQKGASATLTVVFSPEQILWLKNNPTVNIYFPRMVHHSTKIIFGSGNVQKISGYNASLQATIAAESLLNSPDKKLVLKIHFQGYPIFGPQDFPIFFASPKDAGIILDLLHRPLSHMQLRKQLDLGLCLVIVLLSMILSSHRLFSSLAYVACAYGLRSYYYYAVDSFGNFQGAFWAGLGLNLFLFMSAFFFFAKFFTFTPLKSFWRWVFLGLNWGLIVFSFFLFSAESSIYRGDIIVDILMCVTGLIVIVMGMAKIKEIPIKDVELTSKEKNAIRERKAATLLLAVLFIYSGINIFDLLNIFMSLGKDYGHFAHLLFVPGLFLATFMHGGSSKQKIADITEEAVKKQVFATELNLAFDFQKSLLPRRKGHKSLYAWRSFYKSGTTLGGDWLSLGELTTESGTYLLGALFDVAGKGLRAAMVSTVITTSFERFVAEFKKKTVSVSIDPQFFLRELTQQINQDLSLLNFSEGASGSLFVVDRNQKTITYATQGYHGFLLAEVGGKTSYLKSAGPAFGSPYFCPQIKQQAITLPCLTFMLSDGFLSQVSTASLAMRSIEITVFDQSSESAEKSLQDSYGSLLKIYRHTMKYARQNNLPKDDAALMATLIFGSAVP